MNKSRSLLLGCVALTSSSLLLAKVPQLATSWTGLYNDEQKISLFIKQNGQAITGYSLLNGKATNFKGKIEQTDLNYTITLSEVGQGASIGKFVLNYKGNTAPIDADWSSSSKKCQTEIFSLNAQQCKYAKGQGDFPVTSTRLLKDADLQVPLGQLQYMRNEVYARHGYAFQSKEWASIFSQYDWYMPCYTSVESRLTQIEKENIKRIKMVEPYAADVDWGVKLRLKQINLSEY